MMAASRPKDRARTSARYYASFVGRLGANKLDVAERLGEGYTFGLRQSGQLPFLIV